jgi:GntR family transcriptional regulator
LILHLTELSTEPLYKQILKQIRSLILTGQLGEGDQVPAIREFAATHKVSVITVGKAYDELVHEGLLIPRRGKGFYVAKLATETRTKIKLQNFRNLLMPILASARQDELSEEAIMSLVKDILKGLDHE